MKIPLLYDGFFSFAVVRQIDFIIKERADNSRLKVLLAIGAEIVHSPQIFPEHGSNYYATFFKDLDGVKYEIVYNQPI